MSAEPQLCQRRLRAAHCVQRHRAVVSTIQVSPMAFQRVVQLRYRDRNFVYYFSNRRTALCLLQVYLSTIILSVCNNDYSISYFIYWSIVKLLPAYCLLHTDIKCVIPNILFSSHSIIDFFVFLSASLF